MYDCYDSACAEEKAKIRKSKRRARASFCGEKRAAADEAIYNNFIASGFIEKYDSFFVYNSVNSEADTRRIIKTLSSRGKKVYLPRVIGRDMEAVPLSDKFITSPFGIEEPVGNAYTGDIDMAIIPAFAFDLHGRRIGYGGGYYDRFLEDRKIYKVLCAYDFQFMRDIPQEDHDVPADYILTDKRSRPAMWNNYKLFHQLKPKSADKGGDRDLDDILRELYPEFLDSKETEDEAEDD